MSECEDHDCDEYDCGNCGYEHDDFEDDDESSDEDDTSHDDESSDEDTDEDSPDDGKASDNREKAYAYATGQDRNPYRFPNVDDHGDEGDWVEDGALEEIIEKASGGLNNTNKKWCRLFEGKCFTNARQAGHSYLPACTRSEDGMKVTVPSMCVKDMKDVGEYTQVVTTSEGTTYVHKVQLTARKFHTHPVDLSHLFSGWRMTKIGNRYFLDPATGVDASSAALAAAVNHDDDSEIVMPRALLEELLVPFVQKVNKNRGYACCEIGRVGYDWFTARNLLVLGHEHGHAPFQTSEKTKTILPMAVGGNRYIKEFAIGRTIGTKNEKRMFEQYEAGVITQSLQSKDYVPEKWPTGTFPDIPDEPRLKVPCLLQTHTVLLNGGVHRSEEHVTLLVTKPLHGLTFERHHRKSGCIGLDKVEQEPLVNGYSTALSALGASFLDAKPPEYFRIEPQLQTFLKEKLKQQLTEMGDILTLRFVKTSQSHSAGNKGRFPIFKAAPILRICDRWYNPYTLDTFILGDDHTVPENLRYFDVSVEQPKASPNDICRTKTYLTDGSYSETIKYSDGTIATAIKYSKEGRNEATTNVYVPKPSLLGNVAHTASSPWSRSVKELSTQGGDILAAHAFEERLGLISSACSSQPTQDPVGLGVHIPEDGAKLSERDEYHSPRVLQEKMGGIEDDIIVLPERIKLVEGDGLRPPRALQEEIGGIEGDVVVLPFLSPDVISFERHDRSINDTGRPQSPARDPSKLVSNIPDLSSVSTFTYITESSRLEKSVASGLEAKKGKKSKKSSISCYKREHAASSIPPLPHETARGQKFGTRSTTYLADGSCLETTRYSDGATTTVKCASISESIQKRHAVTQPKFSGEKSQDLSVEKHASSCTPKYVHDPTGKKSRMQGLPASPNRVSDPIGMELHPQHAKRIKSRTTKMSSDGLCVEVIEYTDGSKVTKTFTKLA